jgi:hypothetical protein
MNPALRLAPFLACGIAVLCLAAARAQDEVVNPNIPTVLVTDLPPPAVVNGYLQLDFDRLAGYEFRVVDRPPTGRVPQASVDAGIPAVVRSWSGRKADVTGFMVPTRMEKGLVVEFLLVRDMNSCCYGVSPSLNHLVLVKIPKGTTAVFERVVKVSGLFKVNTNFDKNGYMVAIYELAGEKVIATED